MTNYNVLLMRGSIFARTAALLVLLLFMAIGASPLIDFMQRFSSTMPMGGEASTNQFLGILAVHDPATKLAEEFRRWESGATLLFIAPASQPFWRQTYYTMAYLAHPRRVSAVACAGGGAGPEEIQQGKSPKIDGLIFFDIPPGPWAAESRQIGPKLYFTRNHGSPAWKSFCP